MKPVVGVVTLILQPFELYKDGDFSSVFCFVLFYSVSVGVFEVIVMNVSYTSAT